MSIIVEERHINAIYFVLFVIMKKKIVSYRLDILMETIFVKS